MAMPKRILCKFYAHGTCLKGEHCDFSHDWKDPPNNVCVYYQKGCCAYGSRCRYEHTKASRSQSIGSSSSSPSPANPSKPSSSGTSLISGIPSELSASSRPAFPPSPPVWKRKSEHHDVLDGDDVVDSRLLDPADRSICSFAAAGDCPRGDECPHIHGDLCPTCGKHCLHPFRPEERKEHLKMCEKQKKQLEALKCSQEIECCVCLECVLSKSTAAERKFGIMSECNHPFCISCIRNWRSSSSSSGMDVNNTFKACPICRKVSYFVIPSVIWYNTEEEKQEIMDSYKAKLKLIDCKHFDFGNGNCPFGTSCFYKHIVKPGSYTWKYQRPPPRRPPRCRPPPQRNDILDMLDIIDAMEELGELEYETPDDEFLANCEPWQMEFFLDQLGYYDDSIFSSSDDDINF